MGMTPPPEPRTDYDWRICRLHGRAQDDPDHDYKYPDCDNAGYDEAADAPLREALERIRSLSHDNKAVEIEAMAAAALAIIIREVRAAATEPDNPYAKASRAARAAATEDTDGA